MIGLLLAAALAANANAVRIEARDFTLSLPAHLRAGRMAFTLDNRGSEPHDVRFLRLAGRHTVDDFVAWQKSGAAIPAWLVPSGGIGTVAPGLSADYIATLAAGSYVVLCGYPSPDGTPHTAKGMFAPLQIEAGGAGIPAPEADLTVTLSDHHFLLSAPVPAGHPIWHLRNTGSESHQALVVKLPDGINQFMERSWFDHGNRGARPGIPVGGVIDLPAGGEAWFSAELTAGRYLLLCTVVEDEGRHYELGMIYSFVVE
jgi:hypothetical protein